MTELVLARVLQAGSILAAVLMGGGVLLLTFATSSDWGRALVTAGIAVLILTPIMRVVAALAVFVREKDRLYALFCLVVLVAMGLGALLGA